MLRKDVSLDLSDLSTVHCREHRCSERGQGEQQRDLPRVSLSGKSGIQTASRQLTLGDSVDTKE